VIPVMYYAFMYRRLGGKQASLLPDA